MTQPRPKAPRTLVVGALLVVLGLAFWALFVKQSGSERHSYSRGGGPPQFAKVVAGHTYGLAIHGGVRRELEIGIDPSGLQCVQTVAGRGPLPLQLSSVESRDTKATDRIGSFDATVSGRVFVTCVGLGNVYIDNAVDAAYDWSGAFLVLASLALLIGLPLTLSGMRAISQSRAPDFEWVDPAAAEPLEFGRDGDRDVVTARPGDDLDPER